MKNEIKDIEFLQSVFDSSVGGIMVVNHQGLILKTNASAAHLFGYEIEELLDKNVEDLIPDNFRETHKNHIEKYQKQPEDKLMADGANLLGLKKNGKTFSLDATLRQSKLDGKPVVILFVRDNAKRIFADKSSKISKDEMLEAQSLANIGSWSWDLKTNKRIWSDEFYRICGLQPGDQRLNAETVIEFIHPEDRDKAIEAVNTAIKNQTPYNYEKRILRQDNAVRYVSSKGKVEYDKKGTPIFMMGTMQDITGIKQNEILIKKSEERFRLAMLATYDGFYDFNPETNKGWYSQKYIDLFKPTTEKNWWEHNIHPDDKERVLKTVDKVINSKNNYWISEYRLKSNNKSYLYVEDRGSIVRNKQGKATRVLGAVTDITKQKKIRELKKGIRDTLDMVIEQKPIKSIGNKIVNIVENHIDNCIASILLLNDDKNTMHKLAAPNLPKGFSNSIEGISIGSKAGSCGTAAFTKKEVIVSDIANNPLWEDYKALALEHNLEACWSFPVLSSSKKILGTFAIYSTYSRMPIDAEKKIISDMVQLASVAIEQNNTKIALENNKKQLKEYAESLEAKVEERTLELKATVQQLVASNLTLEDQMLITKAAENKSLNSKVMLSAIAENFPKGFVAVVDSNFKIVFVEGEELDELGFKKYSNTKTTFNEVKGVPEDIKETVKNNIQKTLKGKHCSFEIHFQDRSYLVNTTPLFNEEKNITQVLLVHNNITEQKKVEQEIRNTLLKEQELNELKSRFTAMASHEFRTPLTAINSSAILIGKQNEPGKEEKREKYVSQIKTSVKNLVTILNDFLSLSKLEEGKVIANLESLDIIKFSKSIIKELELNKKKGQSIKFINNYPANNANLDPKLLHHILANLLSNAIKYSPENKDITLQISNNHTSVFLEITDQGIGIPDKEQKNMFSRFYRAKNTTNIEGTGLGLNIVKQYTELMNGKVSLKSKLNEGATFIVELPINQKK